MLYLSRSYISVYIKLYNQSFKDSSSVYFLLMERWLNKKVGKGPITVPTKLHNGITSRIFLITCYLHIYFLKAIR